MSRSILLSIMFIAGTLGVIAFSAAQFTDFETDTSVPIDAGTLNLVDLSEDGAPTQVFVPCDVPDDGLEGDPPSDIAETQAVCTTTLNHDGTLEHSDLYIMIDEIEQYGCTDTTNGGPADSSDYCDSSGDLSGDEFTLVSMTSDGSNPAYPGFGAALSTYVGTAPGDCILVDDDMGPADTVTVTYTIELEQSLTSNAMQGDTIRLVLAAELAENGALNVDCAED